MDYAIREVRDCDLDECAKVIRQSFGTVADEFGLTEENCPTNGAFIKKERLTFDREKGNHLYGLISQDRIIGFIELEESSSVRYYLQKLAILPEYRHKGYGRMLLDFAQEKVKELNGKVIEIGIIEDNRVLKDWYLAYGFIHIGTKKFDHLPFTVGYMELPIN